MEQEWRMGLKAGQITDVKKIELVDTSEAEIRENHAVIDVKAMGICGSDVHAYAGKSPNVKYPVIIGHETAGIVTRIAEGSSNKNDIQVGDRVVLNPYLYCGQCYPCSQGRTNCCEHLKCLGVQTGGSMSERFTHPTDLLIKVPENIDWETCAVIEPTVIALHALKNVALKQGEHVVVIGAGCIGMLIGILAIAKGGIPIMVDVVDERLTLAQTFGMKYVINSISQNAIEEIRKITNGRMAECVCEVSGNSIGVRNTLDFVAATGRIALTGWPNQEVPLPTAMITRKEVQIRGSRTGVTSEFQEIIDLISEGKLDIKRIISKIVTMEQIPEAIKDLEAHPGDNLKVIALNHAE